MHCHLSPSNRPCTCHPGYHIHHVSYLLHILLTLSSSPRALHTTVIVRFHHQVMCPKPLELLGISSHLLPRQPTNCLVSVSDSPCVYQHSCVCPDHGHPNTVWCQCWIPSPLVNFPSSGQATHKLSGASIGYFHIIPYVV